MTKRAVGGQEEVMTETEARTNMQQQQYRVLGKWKSLGRNLDELPREGEGIKQIPVLTIFCLLLVGLKAYFNLDRSNRHNLVAA